jgi:hypothetical protein
MYLVDIHDFIIFHQKKPAKKSPRLRAIERLRGRQGIGL